MGERIKLGPTDEIPDNDFKVYPLEAIDVAVYRLGNDFYAISPFCPHSGANLSRGEADHGIITCPGHGLRFDVTTGRCLDMPELVLGRFEVAVENSDLYVIF
jgi:nitrite reductase/ring-hydroxylating ferredoxin subunit